MTTGIQTHEDVEEIPTGVEIPDSSGSMTDDVETPEEADYTDVDLSGIDLGEEA